MKDLISGTLQQLEALESIILKNIDASYKYWKALKDIRDKQLYRHRNCKTFEEYCKQHWDISRARAYQLIGAAETRQNLSTIVDILPSESQARTLSNLSKERQKEIWRKVLATAPEGKITAKLTAKIVKEFQDRGNGEKPGTDNFPACDVQNDNNSRESVSIREIEHSSTPLCPNNGSNSQVIDLEVQPAANHSEDKKVDIGENDPLVSDNKDENTVEPRLWDDGTQKALFPGEYEAADYVAAYDTLFTIIANLKGEGWRELKKDEVIKEIQNIITMIRD